MSNIWFILGPGLVLAFIGTRLRPHGSYCGWEFPWGPATDANAFGRLLYLAGVALAATGIYAGFKGPLQAGTCTLPPFKSTPGAALNSMIHDPVKKLPRKAPPPPAEKDYDDALAYAREEIQMSGRFLSENGRLVLKGEFRNTGDRELSFIALKLDGSGKSERMRLGPFPARSTVKIHKPLPGNLYFVEKRFFIIDGGY
jgi:hypothetical protein